VHAALDVHDTPFKLLLDAPVGFGVLWTAQLVPFQRSASVAGTPALLRSKPTAVQPVPAVHDTPCKALARAPVGLEASLTVQLGLNPSASVTSVPVLLV
jgi:hypothetical protein